ncbi:probable transcription factor At5g28040 isoform X2 [Henckelia pumila]|uniref:probable transcription factor At5g28040 isoform X2 n=1 Tax=Henckelia pumila TaxID=405737 RepID=UPI003C6DDF17
MDSTTNTIASKLPIKRKTPLDSNPTVAPFKFHRIWTEPDEIRFLQGLVDCSSHNLAFPRDLAIFYSRFSNTMSQPYTKSQLSEKLRRLRKKFRLISTRLSKGLDQSQLSPHDRALYDLSKQLWHPDFAAVSPFNGSRDVGFNHSGSDRNHDGMVKKSNLVGVKVDFSPDLPVISPGVDDREFDVNMELECFDDENVDEDKRGDAFLGSENGEEVKLSEVNVKFEGEDGVMDNSGMRWRKVVGLGHVNFDSEDTLGEVVVKVVLNVFDECCNDLRTMFLASGGSGEVRNSSYQSIQSRWQKQRIAELDVLERRLSVSFLTWTYI